jgi:hypothetical protein
MFDGINHIKVVNKIMEKKPCCNHGEHENIDVVCNIDHLDQKWEDRVCKKCFIREAAQNDHEFINKHFIVGGIKDAVLQ